MQYQNKKISRKREQTMGAQIGGRSHIASGALWFQKGDFSNSDIIVEDKFTHKNKFSLTLTILNKIEKEGRKENKIPLITVGFHKQQFSVAIIHSKHLKNTEKIQIPLIFKIKAKSAPLLYDHLYESYLASENNYIGKIEWTIENSIEEYYIIEWETFIENLESLIYL